MHEGIRPKPPKFHETTVLPQADLKADLPQRPNRKPFGSMMFKLAYELRPGFYRRWFNDIPGRIKMAQEAGYEHVLDRDGKPASREVNPTSGGMTAYLMEIPEEWYRQDIKIEQDQIAEKEDTMRRGKFEAPDKGYIPSQGINIRQGK